MHLPGAGVVELNLAALEQAIHTPPIALASMLHRSVTLVHGDADVWVDADESRLLLGALAGSEDRPRLRLIPSAGHGLEEAGDPLIDELAEELVARLLPRELPPVLLAIEGMS